MSKTVSSKAAAAAARDAAKPRWSTSISDAVLAVLTLYACSQLYDSATARGFRSPRTRFVSQWQLIAAAALGLTGAAASAGVFRFAGVTAAQPLHDLLTRLSMFFTMPTLGLVVVVAYTGYDLFDPVSYLPLCFLLLGFLAFEFFPRRLSPYQADYVLATSLFGVLCIFFRAIFVLAGRTATATVSDEAKSSAAYGLVGAVLVMLAGAVGATGAWQLGGSGGGRTGGASSIRVLRVDVFHYLMAAANVCLVHLFQTLWA